MPKGGKSTDHDHNIISSEGAQDTSTCKISDHSLQAFSGKCPETSPDGRTDGQTCACRKMVTVGRMDQWTHVQVKRGYFTITITETKVQGDMPKLEGYERLSKNRTGKEGGVAIAVRNHLTNNAVRVDNLEDQD